MPAKTVWTPERLRIIKSLIKDGALVCTGDQAAVLVGVSPYTIKTYLYKMNIRAKFPNVWSKQHDGKLAAYVKNGTLVAGINTIAKELEVSRNVLASQLRRKSIVTKNNRGDTKRRIGQGVLALSQNGVMTVSTTIAAARLECSVYAVEDMLKAFEIRPAPEDAVPVRLPTPKRYAWTSARKRALKAFTRENHLEMPVKAAASRLGCSIGQLRLGLQLIGSRPTPKNSWTEERLSELRKLLNGHGRLRITMGEACLRMRCDRKSLRLGLVLLSNPSYAQFEWTPRRIAQLRALSHEGILRYPLPDVMHRLGCSEKVLRLAMKKLRLRTAPRFSWTPEAEAKLAKLMRPDGTLSTSYDTAAQIIGCSPRSIDYKMTRDRKA